MTERCWKLLACSRSQVNLDKLLVCGQSFRWKKNGVGEWLGVMANLIWRLRQTEQGVQYLVYGGEEGVTQSGPTVVTAATNKNLSYKQNDGLNVKPLFEYVDGTRTSIAKEEINAPRKSHRKKIPNSSSIIVKTELNENAKERRGRKREITASTKSFESQGDGMVVQLGETRMELYKKVKKDGAGTKEAVLHSGNGNGTPATNVTDQALDDSVENEKHSALLRDYFQMDVDLEKLYHHWSTSDPHFSKVASGFAGIRILRQDPTENLLSFVCSSNNHISRIASMVEKLCRHYGKTIAVVDGEDYYSVPTFSDLSGDRVESHLRELGFGYRAKFISSIAKHIAQHREDRWLETLRCLSYDEAKKELVTLMGVGPKVADCVCLMSLDKPGAIPVDTHVWQITITSYMAKLKTAKSLTDKIYNEIGDFYRNLWGPYAGWAHSVLFTADLRQNKVQTTTTIKKIASKKGKKES